MKLKIYYCKSRPNGYFNRNLSILVKVMVVKFVAVKFMVVKLLAVNLTALKFVGFCNF